MANFEIGRVFGNSFSVLTRNAPLYLGLAAVMAGLPALLMNYLGFGGFDLAALRGAPYGAMPNYAGLFGGGLISFICAALLQAALVRATIEDLNGQTPVFADCLQTAITVLFPVIGITILVSIGAALGLILLVVPGIVLWLGWSVAVPVLVHERLGVFGSMSRSRKLTKGSRWSLLGLYIILVITAWVIQGVFGVMMFTTGPIVGPFMAAIGSTIVAAIMATATAASYIELRTAKEGASFESLVEIFS